VPIKPIKCCKQAIICEQLQGEWVYSPPEPKKLVTRSHMMAAIVLGPAFATITASIWATFYHVITV